MPDKPRFLITTADERSWRTDRPVLFLGEWCRVYDRRSAWAGLDAEVVPEYGWGEGQHDADYAYVQRLYEQLLIELSEALNRYHGTSHSLRYWRILLGLWLYRFTAIAFNRWATIALALRRNAISGTVVLDWPKAQTIVNDSLAFIYAYIGDAWNHALYGRILSGWTNVRIERVAADASVESTRIPVLISPPPLKRRLKRIVARGVSRLASALGRSTDAFVISSHLPLKQDLWLQLSLGQIPQHWEWQSPPPPKVPPNLEVRAQFRLNIEGRHDFEQCVRTLISEQIPTCYLEGYPALINAVAKLRWPKRPKVIFTANNFDTDEIFKAWTAARVEEGIPYVIGQHGGNYGTAKYSPWETHEVLTADRYLTWGWKENNPKHYPAAALKAVGQNTGRWNPSGGLLLIEDMMPYRDFIWGVSNMTEEYLNNQFRFFALLQDKVKVHAIVRLHHTYSWGMGWSEDKRWKDRSPDTRLDFGSNPIKSLIGRNRLTVHSYNSTGIHETLALNIPTLSFWNPKHWELRSTAQPYFNRLKQVGILHETPELAAAKVAKVWDDVAGWWNQPEVQEARLYFCDRFARMPENPIQVLKKALTTVKAGQLA